MQFLFASVLRIAASPCRRVAPSPRHPVSPSPRLATGYNDSHLSHAQEGTMRLFFFALTAAALAAEDLPVIAAVEFQPLAAQVQRLVEALDMLGEPLPAAQKTALAGAKTVAEIQKILDPHCLVGVNINPE